MTRDEALERARTLAREGHTLLPADDPERGMLGYIAYHMVDGEEQSELISWPMFDGPLEPEKAAVTPEEMVAFLDAGPVRICDDIPRRLVGFVRYDLERGVAIIRQMDAVKLKGAEAALRDAIRAVRDDLLSKWDSQRLRPLHDILA